MSLYIETNDSKIIAPHPFQAIILLSKVREIAVVTGQGFGKTSLAPVWLSMDMDNVPGGEYIFTEPTYDMVERLAIPATLDFFKNTELEGEWISKKHHIYGNDFGKIYFLSTDMPEHIQGSHARKAVMDEAGMSPFLAYQMVKNRTNMYNGQILCLSNPYRRVDPWLYTELKARYDAKDPEVLFLTCPSIWNPAFDRKRFNKDKKIMRPEEFAFYYLGVYTKPEGLVFSYDRADIVKDIKYEGQVCYAGADFGAGDPTVLLVAFLNTTGVHLIDEYYKQDVDMSVHAHAFADMIKKYKIREIFYDPSGLVYQKQIDKELKQMKIEVIWTKGKSDSRLGVEEQVKLIRQKRLTISPRCFHMLNEDAGYIWKLNGTLPDKDDHCETARKYMILGLNEKTKRVYEQPKKIEQKAENWIQEHFEKIWDRMQHPEKYRNKDEDWTGYF